MISQAKIHEVSTDPNLNESGGGHNQKGVEFQKHWALLLMFDLLKKGETDFLLLFEAIQDIAVLNSEREATSIHFYQIKKKERKEWSWHDLTSLHKPDAKKTAPLTNIGTSPLGKLSATLQRFGELNAIGYFVSNMGCKLPLKSGGVAATTLEVGLDELERSHVELLTSAISQIGVNGINPARIRLAKTNLPANEPTSHLVGEVHKYLCSISPKHAGQAQALVEALLTRLASLGARTDICNSFQQLRDQHGYSCQQLRNALGELETIPDVTDLLGVWIDELRRSGMTFPETCAVRLAAAAIYRRQVMGCMSESDKELIAAADEWVQWAEVDPNVFDYLEKGYASVSVGRSEKRPEILAHLAIRAIKNAQA